MRTKTDKIFGAHAPSQLTSTQAMKFTFLATAGIIAAADAANILIVGDSMGEFSTNVLETYCSGSTVKNAALGGTKADDWADMGADAIDGCGSSFDYVWMSFGGNDLLESSGCSMSASTIQSKVTAAVNNVKSTIAPGASKYLLTCYCQPQGPEIGSACNTPQLVSKLCDGIKAAADADTDVEYVHSLEACGGSASAWSKSGYFEDQIHLNKRGYCKIITQSAVQSLFECNTGSYNCDTEDCTMTGYNLQCTGDAGKDEYDGGACTAIDNDGGGDNDSDIDDGGGAASSLRLSFWAAGMAVAAVTGAGAII
ncbi:hypothetical protein TL16_g01426 [Triparma laevis f. inornata]|uniref:SGNH hydrolase-type esterase domain-containing protein n=2 Tax=Triparma laevis TaxID=1534972 RepID=A0A9W7C608_9STRA|nr:hypothetical protein TL16_g01426 [Triparma laevis f. inornata]GMI03917.1 hypothetical protein TrLO_g6692 [Triparma laevis f. longispina]